VGESSRRKKATIVENATRILANQFATISRKMEKLTSHGKYLRRG